jgi:internalin A
VSDVTPLAGLTALRSLSLNGTDVSDVTPLAGLTALQRLYLNGTGVSDVSVLRHLKDLTIRGGPTTGMVGRIGSAVRQWYRR